MTTRVHGVSIHVPGRVPGRAPDALHAQLWPAAIVLAEWLDADDVAGRDVVELGCGLGAPGLVAARLGARVLLTDREPEALVLAEANARANGLAVELAQLAWGEPPPDRVFDIVLGADVTYDARARRPLLATIEALLAPDGVAWLADPMRTSRRELRHHTSLDVDIADREDGVVIYQLTR